MSLVVSFEEPQSALVSLVGGKAHNLMTLTEAGFPVPPGFVVTAQAYRAFLDSNPWLDDLFRALEAADPERVRDMCAGLHARIAQAGLPEAAEQAIRAGLGRLGGPPETGTAEGVAVRSSSTLEDLAQAAFAGQHETYLNVRGVDAVLRRVRDCFGSLWSERAVLYRRHHGFSQREAHMAVVVQRQIACDVAGVAFSIDPVSGRLDRIVIDANYGIGESVVSGEVEVDHFELDKRTLEVTERRIGRKERMVVATSDGVEDRAVSPELRDAPCLREGQLAAVGELLRRVESHCGWPQDIEWGIRGESLYLLQSRPVTAAQPRWTRDESAERFPNPMSPLSWDFISTAFRESMTHSFMLMGLPSLQGEWFERFDNYIYGNQNAVELIGAFRPLQARTLAELVAEIPRLRARYGWVLDLPAWWIRDLDRYLLRLGRLSAVRIEEGTLTEIWRHISEILALAADYFRPNIAISMTQAFLHRLVHDLVALAVGRNEALSVVDGLLAGCETKTGLVNSELYELARQAGKTSALDQELQEQGGRAVWERGRLHAFPEFAARVDRFLEDHGHREVDMDYLHPTWSGQPWVVLDSIALILRSELREDPRETARRQRQRYAETEHRLLSVLPEELRFFFRELIRLARAYTILDDVEHYETTRVNPEARRAAVALGRRLQALGVLDAPEDVFFFRKADLDELVRRAPAVQPEAYRRGVYEAKHAWEESWHRTPPWALDQATPQTAPNDSTTLRGLPGSPGRVTGPCFRVRDPADFARFPNGAILVARTMNPAWTCLFYSASAVVTESGGPLSHGAVTAREMRLPAVMAVRGAMERLRDGQVLTVDGSQGIVQMG